MRQALKLAWFVLTVLGADGLRLSTSNRTDAQMDEFGVERSEQLGDEAPFDLQMERVNDLMSFMVEYNPAPHRKAFFEEIPNVIIQYGPHRTATTLQFYALCAIMVLRYPGQADCQALPTAFEAFESIDRLFDDRTYDVFKTHSIDIAWLKLAKAHGHRFWLFATARQVQGGASQIAKTLNVEPSHIQMFNRVKEKGWTIVEDYARIFKLSHDERQQFLTFMEPWSLLRQCCGSQQSEVHRSVLLGQVPSSECPVCDGQDLNAVESKLIDTRIWKQMREGPVTVTEDDVLPDKHLNGTYCTWFNRQVGCQHLAFNEIPQEPFC